MSLFGWHDNDLVVDDLTVNGSLAFADAATDNLIIKGRLSSMSAAGAAIQIAASYLYGEGIEMRYQVTNWTGVGSSFKGMYLRAEAATNSAAGKSVYGAELYGVCNNVTMTTGSLWGTMNYAYVKGADAVTINNMYAVQGELSWDASRTGDCTITTAAACFRAKITGGRVADYTKIHGYELTIGEMDGDSQTFGSGIVMQDDTGMSGTCTLTTGLNILIGCATGISIAGACSSYGLNIAGVCTTAGILLGTTNKISFHDSGIYMRASADGHFEIVSDDTITLSSPGHGGIVFGGETDWGTGATGYDIDGNGWDWVTQTVGHVDSGALATACAASYNALTVTALTHSTASSFFGTWNELYFVDSVDLAGAANAAAVWGQVECGATVSSTDLGDFMAAFYGNFKTGITFTHDSKICGFLAQSEIATSGITGSGVMAAFYSMKKSGSQAWDYGLYIADDGATTGIGIGNATTGLLISGATTEAIDITGNATRAINIGTGAFTSGLTMSAAFSGNALSVTNSALTVGDSYSGVRVTVTAAAANNAYGMAGYFDSTITGTTAGHCYGLGSWINTSTTPVLSAGNIIVPLECGVYTGEAQASARIVLGQFQAILNGAPASLHIFRVNTTQTATAVFAAANAGSIGYTAGSGTLGTQVGYIPIADVVGTGVVYIRVYNSAT